MQSHCLALIFFQPLIHASPVLTHLNTSMLHFSIFYLIIYFIIFALPLLAYVICNIYMLSDYKNCFQDSSGIFADNDSLATLLATELKADLLVLLSDVEGLYDAPPKLPHAKMIHTYVKEKHEGEITFGDKSKVGRGGMSAKVKAAIQAAEAGIPAVITRYSSFNFCFIIQKNLNLESRMLSPSSRIQCLQTLG